jgi:aspartate racemase
MAKHIGLIGGLSPESTVEYYKLICAGFNKKMGKLNFPTITLRSLNLQKVLDFFKADQWDKVADEMIAAINDLENAGADFLAITANTPHNALEAIRARSSLEVLSIMDAVAKEIKKESVSKVALLGTKPTMEYGFFQQTFTREGIQTIVPGEEDRDYLDRLIWEKLSYGKMEVVDRMRVREIAQGLISLGAEGIILGCTELPLLVQKEDVEAKIFDTMKIHVESILNFALEEV